MLWQKLLGTNSVTPLSYNYIGVTEFAGSTQETKTTPTSVSFGTSTATKRVYVLAIWVDSTGVSREINSASIAGFSATLYPVLNIDRGGTAPVGQMFAVEGSNLTSGSISITLSGTTANATVSFFVFEVFNQVEPISSACVDAQETTALSVESVSDDISVVRNGFLVSYLGRSVNTTITWSGSSSLRNNSVRSLAATGISSTNSAYTVSASWSTDALTFFRQWSFRP